MVVFTAKPIATGGISLSEDWKTRRERIAELIMDNPLTPSEIAKIMQMPTKDVLEDLKHIASSQKYGKLVVMPARCKKCGYVFKPEIKIPKKCPKCHSTWIEEPKFKILAKF